MRILRKYTSLTKKRQRLIKASVVLFLVLITVGLIVLLPSHTRSNTATLGSDVVQANPEPQLKAPNYKTLLPEGKSISELGGWARVSPSDRNPVFAFVDSIDGKPVTVSEQPLPADFKEDTNSQIEQLASGYKATEKVTVGTTLVFIGTSTKGPQSVIFYKNNILFLIKSSVPLTQDQWAKYVNTLQ